ncbi:probable pectin methylesterase CGR2 isoform X2 [Mangifera indica]|uniref:probable pectin methylesterase CGR2 isoform X2 n=1 Tax=Mangifera indica TaxID=29780 RepID=UPI001CFBAB57|nr:probable pectin methylesterase CGR2 isoform X2 [Mangifera indica]
MSRRVTNSTRRYGDSGTGGVLASSKSRSSPCSLIGLIIVGAMIIMVYLYSGSGDYSCTIEVQQAIPILKKAYGDSMHRVLHVGPDTCSVVSRLLKDEETEAWGVEPYDIEDADGICRGLVRKGLVRVADVKFSLPYRPKSFSVAIVSDALDYLSLRYLNNTLPDLARVSAEGIIIFTGYPGRQRSKVAEVSKFGKTAKLRSSSWWVRYFAQNGLEEDVAAARKFEKAATKSSYNPNCQIFHLKSFH